MLSFEVDGVLGVIDADDWTYERRLEFTVELGGDFEWRSASDGGRGPRVRSHDGHGRHLARHGRSCWQVDAIVVQHD